jgi:hypothetical protein
MIGSLGTSAARAGFRVAGAWVLVGAWLFAQSVTTHAQPDGGLLDAADRADYLHALSDPGKLAVEVDFEDLWEHPDRYRGRRVRLEGRATRRWSQPPVGPFPALTELWLTTPGNNLVCAVYPTPDDPERTAPLDVRVAVEGTYLRRVRYAGGDVPRLAPLIVGPGPPSMLGPVQAPSTQPVRVDDLAYWLATGSLAGTLGLLLAWWHWRRPIGSIPPKGRR